MADTISELLAERDGLARQLAGWRRRWDEAVAAERGSAERSMAGVRPLDDYAYDIAYPDQASPSLEGGGAQLERGVPRPFYTPDEITRMGI